MVILQIQAIYNNCTRNMKGIKVGNFLMYRNSLVCLICNITSNGNDAPTSITGIDSNNLLHEGPVSDWSSVIGHTDAMLRFGDNVFRNILQSKEAKAKG